MPVAAIFTRLPVIAATALLTLSSGYVAAQSEPAAENSPAVSDRPRIGLALGGGGAKEKDTDQSIPHPSNCVLQITEEFQGDVGFIRYGAEGHNK